jgi:hypothetical protein
MAGWFEHPPQQVALVEWCAISGGERQFFRPGILRSGPQREQRFCHAAAERNVPPPGFRLVREREYYEQLANPG